MILANSRHGPEETFHRCTSMVFPSEGRMPIPTHLRRRWSHKLERPSVPKLLSGVEAPAKLEYPFWTIIWGRNRLRLYLSKHILGVDFWQPSYHAGDALIASQIDLPSSVDRCFIWFCRAPQKYKSQSCQAVLRLSPREIQHFCYILLVRPHHQPSPDVWGRGYTRTCKPGASTAIWKYSISRADRVGR